MDQPVIYVTKNDAKKLRDLLLEARYSDYRGSAYLHMLTGELDKARVVDPNEIPRM
ncbi:MAG: hypothetical protein M5U05_07790 [Anaerolineales bacterium]|nr:hypothetical protein [Anaerolineales bacterium]